MKTFFYWKGSYFDQNKQEVYEEKLKDDFNAAFRKDPKEAHVYIYSNIPNVLSGFVTDETGKEICTFSCEILSGNTASYKIHLTKIQI